MSRERGSGQLLGAATDSSSTSLAPSRTAAATKKPPSWRPTRGTDYAGFAKASAAWHPDQDGLLMARAAPRAASGRRGVVAAALTIVSLALVAAAGAATPTDRTVVVDLSRGTARIGAESLIEPSGMGERHALARLTRALGKPSSCFADPSGHEFTLAWNRLDVEARVVSFTPSSRCGGTANARVASITLGRGWRARANGKGIRVGMGLASIPAALRRTAVSEWSETGDTFTMTWKLGRTGECRQGSLWPLLSVSRYVENPPNVERILIATTGTECPPG